MTAAARNELTEALCLLPPVQRSFAAALSRLKERMSGVPRPEEPTIVIPEAVEFEPLEEGQRVPMYVVGWFSGALALALIASFWLGFLVSRISP